jgi:4-hydroxy-tetrahydrodipicolinate reductase
MGQRLIALAAIDRDLELVAALDSANHPRLGEDAGLLSGAGRLDVPLAAMLDEPAQAVIDFSVPEAVDRILGICLEKKIPLVTATTGLSPEQTAKLQAAGREIPVLWAPNMSLAVNLTMKLADVAARALADKDADVEILERHHRFKEDSPSGTALKFGEIIAGVMGLTEHRHGRTGRPGKRPHNEIGFHAIRVGDNPGEHTIIFALLGESIEMTVRATNRDCYALGALAAAKFLAQQKPGFYGMKDVLGF